LSIQFLQGGKWTRIEGLAKRISVDKWGQIWIIGSDNKLWERNNGAWRRRTDATARDLAVGLDGIVWYIGTVVDANGNYGIFSFNSATGVISQLDGAGTEISVGPNGLPWVINAKGDIFQRTRSAWV